MKIENQRTGGLAQTIELPEYKWEMINDFIWVIVDRMTNSAHFLPIKTTYLVEYYAKLYLQELVRLHRVSVSIISYKGA